MCAEKAFQQRFLVFGVTQSISAFLDVCLVPILSLHCCMSSDVGQRWQETRYSRIPIQDNVLSVTTALVQDLFQRESNSYTVAGILLGLAQSSDGKTCTYLIPLTIGVRPEHLTYIRNALRSILGVNILTCMQVGKVGCFPG